MQKNDENSKQITFQIRLAYETLPGEEVFIYGDNNDFGNWHPNFKLYWSEGNIWTADYTISESTEFVKFKFVVRSSNHSEKWEEGDNRLLSTKYLNGLEKTDDGKYILDCIWGVFKINFNIHYIVNNSSFMRIIGGTEALNDWQNAVIMELENDKIIKAKDGNIIKGFWTKTLLMKSDDKKNFNFDYRYNVYDNKLDSAIWEREPNRHIHILTELNEQNYDNFKNNPDEYKLLTNSFLEVLDVNFVADLIFNRMGDKNIYIGPYPQNYNDYKTLKENGITATLNVQSEKDLKHRQINLELHKKQAKELGIEIHHFPILDFSAQDLENKLKDAADLLNDLLKKGKVVYVHCTAGMSRASATVILYLVLYENYTVMEAKDFCRKYRPVICPNYAVINKVAAKYKPGSEMKEDIEDNTDIELEWKKLRENDILMKKNKVNSLKSLGSIVKKKKKK